MKSKLKRRVLASDGLRSTGIHIYLPRLELINKWSGESMHRPECSQQQHATAHMDVAEPEEQNFKYHLDSARSANFRRGEGRGDDSMTTVLCVWELQTLGGSWSRFYSYSGNDVNDEHIGTLYCTPLPYSTDVLVHGILKGG